MAITVRAAAANDRDACLALISTLTGAAPLPAWTATYDALLSGARGAILVAAEDGQVLGVATVSYNLAIRYAGEYCALEELIVDPAARGRNVGGLLVAASVEAARERGCGEMGLYLIPTTEHNQPFYEKYGFRRVGSELRQPFAGWNAT